MTSKRWQLVTKIFDAAIDLPQGARPDFVRRECKGEADLEAEVLRLLAADEHAGSFLERPAVTTISSGVILNHADFPVGSVVCGRFEILRFIGQGGMGQVYEALDLELKTRIALKAIRSDISSDPRMLSRFRREVQLTRLITHPNVCRTFDIERHSSDVNGRNTDITFLTMELLDGETLAAFLQRKKQLTTVEAMPLVLQMIDALSAAHAVGIVHRDFKPSNVLLVPSSATPVELRVVVTDFGLACNLSREGDGPEKVATSLTGSQGFMGTLVYMAPEQFERGQATIASDIYSLGLVMYEMVTGARPFADLIPFAEAAKRLKQPAPSPTILVPELDPAWEAAICRCLETEAGNRFESAEAIGDSLQQYQFASSVPASTKCFSRSRARKQHLTANRRQAAKISVIVLLLLSLSGGLLRLIQRLQPAKVPAGSEILLTEILNESQDDELNGATELLRNQLAQSAYTNLMEPKQVDEALERMSLSKHTELTPKRAREVAWRNGVPMVIFGTISRVAEDYRLDLKAERVGADPSYPKGSWRFSETAANKKDFFDVVKHGGTWVRRLAGEAQNDIENTDRRLDDVTTSSWEALKLYSDGQRLASQDRLNEAALLFKQAAEKDPEFAMAWMRLGDTLDTIGKSSEGFAYWRKALDVSGDRRLSPREELRIKGMYASDTGDLKAAIDYFSQYSIAYPNDYLGYFYRGEPLMLLGRTEEAIEVLHEAEKLAPNSYYIADHLARYNLILGNFAEVSRYTAEVRDLKHSDWADEVDGQAAVLSGDYDRADKLFFALRKSTDPYLSSISYQLQASSLAERGRYKEAIVILNAGVAADSRTGNSGNRADKLLGLAYLYLKSNNREAARDAALKSADAEHGLRRITEAGSLLARAGFTSDVDRLLDGLSTDERFIVARVARLRLHGEILLARSNCERALPLMQKAITEDQERALLHDYWGRSLSLCKRSDEAMREFAELRKYPGGVWHQAESYMPGYNADLLFESAQLSFRLGRPDASKQLSAYIILREGSAIPQLAEAKTMFQHLTGVVH